MKLIDLTNQVFNKWTVIEQVPGNSQAKWLCKCACGTIKIVYSYDLRNGKTKSCRGCFTHKTGKEHAGWKGYQDIPGIYWYTLTKSAAKRGHQFKISIEQAWKQFISQNKRCALTNIPLTFRSAHERSLRSNTQTASLDRIDSDQGYIVNNIQWVYKDINIMKSKFDQKYFIKLCQMVTESQYELYTT
jgi:hypothetical protein